MSIQQEPDSLDKEPLIEDGERDGDLSATGVAIVSRTVPRRSIVVEPLLMLYALAGIPIINLKAQYMYQAIAEEMGIDLKNLPGKFQQYFLIDLHVRQKSPCCVI